MEKKLYIVTDQADVHTRIAGKRLAPGTPVLLTEKEAEWEIGRGVVALDPESAPNKPKD